MAGATPMRTSVNAKVTLWEPSATSAAPTMPSPPARTWPSRRATTGLGMSRMRRSSPTITSVIAGPLEASLRSAPAQNTEPVWVSSTARTDESSDAVSRCASSSAHSCRDSAFRLCGESSSMRATPRSAE